MNAAAYLTNQGWRGDGHALHHSGRGITKPIHISQKANVLGVGKKQYDAHADQWWARAFDDTLKGLSVTANKVTRETERTPVGFDAQAFRMEGSGGPKWIGESSLYRNFVRGESLIGTLETEEKDHAERMLQSRNQTKRKRGSDDVGLVADVVGNLERSERKRWQDDGNVAECSKLIDFDVIQLDPREVGTEQRCEEGWERRKPTETKEQRRQRKGGKKAKRALKASESCELPGQHRATASNHISTSGRPRKRRKELLHTVDNAAPVVTRPCSRDGNRKTKSEERRRAGDSQHSSRMAANCVGPDGVTLLRNR